MHTYEVRPRKDHRGVDLLSDAASHAVSYAKHFSRSHHAVIRVYDAAGNIIETHEQGGMTCHDDYQTMG